MAGILITSILSAAMLLSIWLLLKPRRARGWRNTSPGGLSEAERRRLYRRLGLDPPQLNRRAQAKVLWPDSRRHQRQPGTKV